jgi:hypothetical protein
MDDLTAFRTSLDQFRLPGQTGELCEEGKAALDSLLLLISDMKLRKGSIAGTCARYFLLIDPTWTSKLCISAGINYPDLRRYLWQLEIEEASDFESVLRDLLFAAPRKRASV